MTPISPKCIVGLLIYIFTHNNGHLCIIILSLNIYGIHSPYCIIFIEHVPEEGPERQKHIRLPHVCILLYLIIVLFLEYIYIYIYVMICLTARNMNNPKYQAISWKQSTVSCRPMSPELSQAL